jgi:hypothetical protein
MFREAEHQYIIAFISCYCSPLCAFRSLLLFPFIVPFYCSLLLFPFIVPFENKHSLYLKYGVYSVKA